MFFKKKPDPIFVEDEDDNEEYDSFVSSKFFEDVDYIECFPLQYLRGIVDENNNIILPEIIDKEARETAQDLIVALLAFADGNDTEKMRIVNKYLNEEFSKNTPYHFAGIIECILRQTDDWYSKHPYLRSYDGAKNKDRHLERYLQAMMDFYNEMADVLEKLLDKGIKSVDEISDNEEFILVYGKYDDDEEVIESDGTCDN